MKVERNQFRIVLIALIGIVLLLGASCTKNDIYYEDATGILSFRFQLPDGRVFDCEVDQPNLERSNSEDSLLYGTSSTALEKIKPIYTTTIGAKVLVNGVEVKSGENQWDITQP